MRGRFGSMYSHGFIRASVCIPSLRVADPAFNLERTLDLALRAAQANAAVALFPELGLSAYSNEDLFHQDALLDASKAAVARLIQESVALTPVLIVGAPFRFDGKLFNCAVIAYRGRVLGIVPKTYLPNYREFYEKRQFTSGRYAVNPRWSYTLLHGSYLIDDCPPCGRPTILEPLRGKFSLRLVEENPLFSRYELTNIAFTAGSIAGRTYRVVGHGSYTVGGDVALRQDMFLEVQIDDGVTNRVCYLTNATPTVNRRWPLLDVELVQTNGTFTQVYHLHLLAAPMRDLWFSTAHGMTPGRNGSPGTAVGGQRAGVSGGAGERDAIPSRRAQGGWQSGPLNRLRQ